MSFWKQHFTRYFVIQINFNSDRKESEYLIPLLSVISGTQPTALNMDTKRTESVADFLFYNWLVLVDLSLSVRSTSSEKKKLLFFFWTIVCTCNCIVSPEYWKQKMQKRQLLCLLFSISYTDNCLCVVWQKGSVKPF